MYDAFVAIHAANATLTPDLLIKILSGGRRSSIFDRERPAVNNPPTLCASSQAMILTLRFFLTRRNLFGPDGMPCVVLWRPEALDCRVLIPPEALNGLTRNPPSLGYEPQTSCIRESILKPDELSVPLRILFIYDFLFYLFWIFLQVPLTIMTRHTAACRLQAAQPNAVAFSHRDATYIYIYIYIYTLMYV